MTVDYATADGTRHRSRPTTPRPAARSPSPPARRRKTITVAGQGRHARRARRDLHRQPLGRRQRDASPTARAGHDHRRRRAARVSIGDVTVTEGNSGTSTPPSPSRSSAASGKTVTVDYATRRRHGHGAGRLHRGVRHADLRPGPDQQDRHRPRQRRHARRAERDVPRQPVERRQRHDRRRPGRRHDHRRRPARRRASIGDVTVTEGNARHASTRPSPSRSPRASGQTVTVDYATADGTATAARRLHGGDRHADLRARARRRKTVTVVVNGDTLDEANETFTRRPHQRRRTRRSPTRSGAGTITDDDPLADALDRRRDASPRANCGHDERHLHRHASAPPAARR